jgi:uncharacterized protein (TIGR02147 family)
VPAENQNVVYQSITDNMPVIFDYRDFKKFLVDYYEARRRLDSTYSKSTFCREVFGCNNKIKAKLKHRGYLNEIVKGKMPLTANVRELLIQTLKFNEEEANYFRVLVDYCQSTVFEERRIFSKLLFELPHTYFR